MSPKNTIIIVYQKMFFLLLVKYIDKYIIFLYISLLCLISLMYVYFLLVYCLIPYCYSISLNCNGNIRRSIANCISLKIVEVGTMKM